MIKHVVMWKLKENASGNTKEVNKIIIKEKLESLQSKIPEIKLLEVYLNSDKAEDRNFDVLLISDFNNFEEMAKYSANPDHQEVALFIKEVVESRVAVDSEF